VSRKFCNKMNKLGRILVVDDDPMVLEAIKVSFIDEYEIVLAASGEEAVSLLIDNQKIDAIILDIRMARVDGLVTASRLKEISPNIPIIFHTGYPGGYSEEVIENEYQPFDYVGKNERPARLKRAVRNAVRYYQLKTGSTDLINLSRVEYDMVGSSEKMQEVYQKIEKIGPTNSKVMILGQTGTGKELVARAIHKRSNRSDKPLAILNCSKKESGLIASELFGHLRGSFTGAFEDQIGMFEYADKGTLFLDEIGDLDITTQVKILRVLDAGIINRIGSPVDISVDVRFICATNLNLEKMIEEGTFREDLYYRLKGVVIPTPALRNRREDISELLDYFIEKCCAKNGSSLKIFDPKARELLIQYDWPGNVRHLMDSVQSLIYLSPSYFITHKEVSEFLECSPYSENGGSSLSEIVREFKKTVILQTLDRHNKNMSAAARELKVDPSNLRKLIKEFNIS